MIKIRWKENVWTHSVTARIGCVIMDTHVLHTNAGKKLWYANASIVGQSGTFKTGCKRKSMAKAKEDAVRLARELLLDNHTCLLAEMKNFDLET